MRELEVEEAVAFTVLLEERGRRLLLLSLGGTSRLEFLEGAQADSVTELGDEIRCVDAGTGCALLKNGLDLFGMSHQLFVALAHRADFGVDLVGEALLGLTPAKTFTEFLTEGGGFFFGGEGVVNDGERGAVGILGALTGIQMAYETASGQKLDETKKELATEEMVVTGNLADSVGQNDATTVINQAKMQVIADNVQNADDIYNIVVNISNNNNVTLTDDEINTIVNLLQQISQQDYDYSEMQETLERVNDNVTGKAEESSDSSDDEDSIVDNVDQSALVTMYREFYRGSGTC